VSTYPTPELFRGFPELRERIPWVPLARATPVHRLGRLESYLHAAPIWVKRDDLTSHIYGGNEARKFEFVFGDLLRRGSRRVLTFGAVGSNHSLAVTAFAHHFNLQPVLALVRQSTAGNVGRTLQLEHELGAELHRLDGGPRALWRLGRSLLRGRSEDEEPRLPYVVSPRRCAAAGVLGYVNAACELKRQINCGILPEPERIYVALGSGATAAGLLLGCELAGVSSRIVAVSSATRPRRDPFRLARRIAGKLRARTRRFPTLNLRRSRLEVRREFAGGPSLATSAAQHAAGLLRDLESLDLDPVYTSRAMAALIEDVRSGKATGPVLFWQTSAIDIFSRQPTSQADALPREFREFFLAR
jgi:D-cysteine desulfhydrase